MGTENKQDQKRSNDSSYYERKSFYDKNDFMLSKQWRSFFEKITDHQAHILLTAIFDINCDGALSTRVEEELKSDQICEMFLETMFLDYIRAQISRYEERCRINKDNRNKHKGEIGDDSSQVD